MRYFILYSFITYAIPLYVVFFCILDFLTETMVEGEVLDYGHP